MKLFVWNLEYNVIMSIANTVEEARVIIKNQNELRKVEVKKLYGDIWDEKKEIIEEKYNEYSELTECNNYVDDDDLKLIMELKPDIELPVNEKMARIYQHSNL